MLTATTNTDQETNGLLRIGLSDRRELGPSGLIYDMPEAYRYVDEYRDVEDAASTCVLSSYIPGVTGTIQGTDCSLNTAVKEAWKRVYEMEQLGFVKQNGTAVVSSKSDVGNDDDATLPELYYWDGGLSDVFPIIDENTIIVSPANGIYKNPSIAPSFTTTPPPGLEDQELNSTTDQSPTTNTTPQLPSFLSNMLPNPTIPAHALVELGVNLDNAETLWRMLWSSEDDILEERFRNGYDDALRFLKDNQMIRVY